MPLYEYECSACGRRFEKVRRFADPPLERCKLCGKGPVQKLASAPAVHFKGTGWYVTDYAKKDSAGASEPASSAPTTPSASGPTTPASSSSSANEKKPSAAADPKPAEKK
jgi:putative FmdB family regulatory protein